MRRALVFGLALGAGIAALAAGAPAASAQVDAAAVAEWQERLHAAQGQLAAAERHHAEAVDRYREMRHRRRVRGENKAQVLEAVERTRADVIQAEMRVDSVIEQARLAGVPPGKLTRNAPVPAAPAD